jgi:hypothetical protein
MHGKFASLQKKERIKGLHRWASMAHSFVRLWKIFHRKWSLAIIETPLFWLGCAPPNLLQNSTSAIPSTSNEYSITLVTSWKTLKPTFSLPLFYYLVVHCKNFVQRFLQPNFLSQPHFGLSVRMKLTLPKVGTWSPLGLTPRSSSGVKTPCIWGVLYTIGKVLKCRCSKWPRMSHLDIFSTSYGRKKGRESNW